MVNLIDMISNLYSAAYSSGHSAFSNAPSAINQIEEIGFEEL